jgi:hypothetical protein
MILEKMPNFENLTKLVNAEQGTNMSTEEYARAIHS